MTETLNPWTGKLEYEMQFDHIVEVHPDGTVTDTELSVGDRGSYFDLNVAPDGTDQFDISAGWELLKGFTGQYSYNGPVMHPSEFIGGGLERHILDTPGYYVVLEVSARCDYDGTTECTEDSGCDCEPAGWTVAYHAPTVEVSFRVQRHGWARGTVTAVFSGEAGAPGWNVCYAHDGQHSDCDKWWVRNDTRPATPEEYAPLLQELKDIGYFVSVVSRIRWVK